jgi:hypothetical protein
VKKPETILKEYVGRLSEENLRFLIYRLDQRLGADLAEALDLMSSCSDLDKWFGSAKSSDELYDMIDVAQAHVRKEIQRKEAQVR